MDLRQQGLMVAPATDCKALYLDLIKKCVRDLIYRSRPYHVVARPRSFLKRKLVDALNKKGLELIRPLPFDQSQPDQFVYPAVAHTMINLKRLDNLQTCIERALADDVPGDLIETGVWRGGAAILMRATLKAHNISDRRVWVADSFEGLPRPDAERYPADAGDTFHLDSGLRVSLEAVQVNFASYSLLDEQVMFLKGYFRETLPRITGVNWAVIRMDGDMYESTMDAFVNLYPNLSPGGYVIIDDYNLEGCRRAVHDYRDANGIKDEIKFTDGCEVYWRRGG